MQFIIIFEFAISFFVLFNFGLTIFLSDHVNVYLKT